MKDVGQAVVAIFLWCFFTQIGHSCGERRQNAIHEFHTYDKTVPVVYSGRHQQSSTLTEKGHLPDATIVLTAFQKVLTLDLVLNRHLLPANYTEKYFLPDGSSVVNTPENHTLSNCYYHGDVRDSSHSSVAVSTCNGLSGYIQDGVQVFYIEPIDGVLTGQHYIYRATDRIRNNATTGIINDIPASLSLGKIPIKSSRKKRSVRWPYDRDSNTRIVELYVVNDYREYVNNDRNIHRTMRRTKDIINIVSGMYRAVDIYVALVGIEIWTEQDQIDVVDDATVTMNNFLEYRRTSICPQHRNDNAQMISGHIFLNGVVGKATIGGICSYQYSGGVDMDHSTLVMVAGTTITHEMGHNFGLKHDGIGCDCPLPRCIMSPSSGGAETVTWSSCSTEQFADAFHQGFDYCLRNLPDKLYGGTYCGNGFVEDGEECDCGLKKECDTKCCDPSTCKLTANATCATGQCCDLSTCQLKPTTTPCRPAKNVCDLPEFCNGEVEFCPSDVSLENGAPCQNDVSAAYCYEGDCHSHGSQCQLLWGKTGAMSHDQCYSYYNTYGAAYGHCGFNWVNKKFKKCAKKDVMCGMLHCTHRNEKLMFWSDRMSYTMPSNKLPIDGEKVRCLGAVLDVGLDMFDPGMVPNGAKCGDDKLCVNHECVPVASLDNPVSPDCHSKGVCNSLGQCHCQVGYAPPYCDKAGNGGSLHSGPIKIYTSSKSLLVGLLVFFLLILPLLALAVFCGYLHRAHLKKVWRNSAAKRYRSVCKNVPRCDMIWKRSAKRTPSTRQQQSTDLNRTASFRLEDISHPRNLNSTNRNIDHMTPEGHHRTPGGRHMTPGGHHYPRNDTEQPIVQVIGSHGNSNYDDTLLPTRPAPAVPVPARPAPVPPQRPVPVLPQRPSAGPFSATSDHEYANRPARPPPPQKQQHPSPKGGIKPQWGARQPMPSPRTQPTDNQEQPSYNWDALRDNTPVTEGNVGRPEDEEKNKEERRERFQRRLNGFESKVQQQPIDQQKSVPIGQVVKPTLPMKPKVARSESQTSRAGCSRPHEKPPPPPASTKPKFNK